MKLKLTFPILMVALFATITCARLMSHAQESPRRVEVVAKRFEFTPSEITLKKGEPVILVLTSKDVQHGFNWMHLTRWSSPKKARAARCNSPRTRPEHLSHNAPAFAVQGTGQ